MAKIEPQDMMRLKLLSIALGRENATLDTIKAQDQIARLALRVAALEGERQEQEIAAVEASLSKLTAEFKERYGFEDGTEINWETGEITEKAPTEESDTDGAGTRT